MTVEVGVYQWDCGLYDQVVDKFGISSNLLSMLEVLTENMISVELRLYNMIV